ncbi:hypothetical protein DL766_000650 [Monosporascus sp. MC13-8B]|nr:hypothetical protein DL766_000650 [Monosporascus sp. MC13-8B]
MQVHFIFPCKDSNEDDRKLIRDKNIESFKNNRVLLSIADGRLPDERPNYDYFARLLSADNDIFLRPKQCWIFVSSSKVTLKEKHVTAEDGTTRKQISGYDPDGRRVVGEADYPHLRLNEDKDYKNLRLDDDRPSVLLHEYTRALTQKESCSAKEISDRWRDRFPELAEKLGAALSGGGARASDERTSRCVLGPCDTLHFEAVLDLHSKQFPSGSELNGVVELSVSRPDLHNHRWRTVTTVVKPESLYLDDGEPDYHDRDSPVDVIASHRAGCTAAAQRGGGGVCDCAARGGRDTLSIRFPASSWANTLFRLAPFVSATREERELEREREREHAKKDKLERPGGKSRPRAKQEEANNRNASSSSQRPSSSPPQSSSHAKRSPAPSGTKRRGLMDLLEDVAMYQEIWSAPNDGIASGGGGSKRSSWTRRAVLLWTFVPAHEKTDSKGKTTVVPAGTNWRFMSKLDPTSQYHQQRAYLSGPPSTTAAVALSGCTAAGEPGSHLAGLNLLDAAGYVDVDGGLATPPPTVNLQGSAYAHSFDGGHAMVGGVGGGNGRHRGSIGGSSADSSVGVGAVLHHHHHHPHPHSHHNLSFMSDSTTATGSESHPQQQHQGGTLVGLGVGGDSHTAAADPFLSGLGGAAGGYEDAGPVDCDGDLQAWAQGGIQGLADASQWATAAGGYGGDGHRHHHRPHHHHHHPVTSSWADTPDLTPAAMAELRDAAAAVQWGAASPSHHWASGGEDKGAAAALWSSPPPHGSGNDNNDHPKPHEQQQHRGDVTDQDAWTAWQAVEAAGRQQPWGDEEHHGGVTPTATAAVVDSRHDGSFSLGTAGLTPLRGGRKRSRAESLDGDDDRGGGRRDGQASYRVSSMRKLTHHHGSDGAGAAPTAVMGEEYQL